MGHRTALNSFKAQESDSKQDIQVMLLLPFDEIRREKNELNVN